MAKRFFCIRKCFHKARLWSPGEILETEAGEVVPHHFAAEKPADPVPVPDNAPRTMTEYQERAEQPKRKR